MSTHALEGRWILVSVEMEGEVQAFQPAHSYTFEGNKAWFQNAQTGKIEPFQFRVDDSKSPKELDFDPAGRSLWIYRIEGRLLTLCRGSVRPTEFGTCPGDDREQFCFSRDEP